ncbi:acetyl-CoA carboxylase biotin carboxyl carrier protein [Salinicoccus siamensis]|uniref:Acetyl-CoA carboxylase biotin carboxyl carrier protein n=1 Tax=Salinicoccus siamensis TaxID=381830 RepID=A0ABV5Z5B8_9STAP
MDVKKVKAYAALMQEQQLKVLTVEDGDFKIHLEAQEKTSAQPQPAVKDDAGDSGAHTIDAGQVGTFYIDKDEDGKETYTAEGEAVKKGDVLGVIEAMKVFNDVVSDVDGTVEEILVGNGEGVEYGQPLISIRQEGD